MADLCELDRWLRGAAHPDSALGRMTPAFTLRGPVFPLRRPDSVSRHQATSAR